MKIKICWICVSKGIDIFLKKTREKTIYIYKTGRSMEQSAIWGLNKACQKPTNKEGWIDVLINLLTRRPLQRSVGHHQAMYN